jgi:hypothetical protein
MDATHGRLFHALATPSWLFPLSLPVIAAELDDPVSKRSGQRPDPDLKQRVIRTYRSESPWSNSTSRYPGGDSWNLKAAEGLVGSERGYAYPHLFCSRELGADCVAIRYRRNAGERCAGNSHHPAGRPARVPPPSAGNNPHIHAGTCARHDVPARAGCRTEGPSGA